MIKRTPALMLIATLVACTLPPSGDDHESPSTRRFQLPPQAAAECFARNAEAHSSALVSHVTPTGDGGARVLVQVKNGVTYATGEFRRAGSATLGSLSLRVVGSVGRDDLVSSLTQGC